MIIAEDENQQESLKRQYLPDPKLPSAKEVEEHNIDHYPYRSWCRFGVEGRSRGERHVEKGTDV